MIFLLNTLLSIATYFAFAVFAVVAWFCTVSLIMHTLVNVIGEKTSFVFLLGFVLYLICFARDSSFKDHPTSYSPRIKGTITIKQQSLFSRFFTWLTIRRRPIKSSPVFKMARSATPPPAMTAPPAFPNNTSPASWINLEEPIWCPTMTVSPPQLRELWRQACIASELRGNSVPSPRDFELQFKPYQREAEHLVPIMKSTGENYKLENDTENAEDFSKMNESEMPGFYDFDSELITYKEEPHNVEVLFQVEEKTTVKDLNVACQNNTPLETLPSFDAIKNSAKYEVILKEYFPYEDEEAQIIARYAPTTPYKLCTYRTYNYDERHLKKLASTNDRSSNTRRPIRKSSKAKETTFIPNPPPTNELPSSSKNVSDFAREIEREILPIPNTDFEETEICSTEPSSTASLNTVTRNPPPSPKIDDPYVELQRYFAAQEAERAVLAQARALEEVDDLLSAAAERWTISSEEDRHSHFEKHSRGVGEFESVFKRWGSNFPKEYQTKEERRILELGSKAPKPRRTLPSFDPTHYDSNLISLPPPPPPSNLAAYPTNSSNFFAPLLTPLNIVMAPTPSFPTGPATHNAVFIPIHNTVHPHSQQATPSPPTLFTTSFSNVTPSPPSFAPPTFSNATPPPPFVSNSAGILAAAGFAISGGKVKSKGKKSSKNGKGGYTFRKY